MDTIQRIQGPIFDVMNWLTGRGNAISAILSVFSVAVIIFVVFPLRECAIGYVAKLLGDDTAEREGRLTLNPFVHIDPIGALCLCFCCFGWPKPAPVNYNRCRKVKATTAVALIALAGPVANILVSLLFMIIAKIVAVSAIASGSATMYYIYMALQMIITINIYLAVLHLIPIPPLSGSRVLYAFLPAKGIAFMERYSQIFYWGFIIALFTGLLDWPLDILTGGLYWLLDKLTFFL